MWLTHIMLSEIGRFSITVDFFFLVEVNNLDFVHGGLKISLCIQIVGVSGSDIADLDAIREQPPEGIDEIHEGRARTTNDEGIWMERHMVEESFGSQHVSNSNSIKFDSQDIHPPVDGLRCVRHKTSPFERRFLKEPGQCSTMVQVEM